MQIRKALSAMVLALLSSSYLLCANAQDAKTAQQQRMKSCNAEAGAKSLKGDERKAFMSSCLKGETAAAEKATPQQQRMKDCNAEAGSKSMKGDARKSFMSACLKGETKGEAAKSAGATKTGEPLKPQQQKMKDCNQQAGAKGLKEDARKSFMSQCLKG